MKDKTKFYKLDNRNRGGYTTWGSMWEKGDISPDDTFVVRNEEGKIIPSQERFTAFWPDGSV